jgi:steroid delta-isomerase-like uncharacterized protein
MKKLLMIIPLVILLCFTFGCQDKEAKAELEEFKAQAEVEEQNKGLVKRMYEAWEKGDFEAYKEVVAPEYVWYLPSRSTKPMSREETIEFGKMLRNAFPDIIYSIEELIAVEDRVISRFIVRGTHEGEYQGIPATGNKIEVSGIMMTRIENGKIVEDKEELDALGLMMQLGMELKPKEEEK